MAALVVHGVAEEQVAPVGEQRVGHDIPPVDPAGRLLGAEPQLGDQRPVRRQGRRDPSEHLGLFRTRERLQDEVHEQRRIEVPGGQRDVTLPTGHFDAALLVYFVLEAFSRSEQPKVLARIAASLAPDGTLIAELRLRPEQPPGRIDWWDVVPNSLLSDRRHLLLGDAVYDQRRHTYVLREVAIFDDGSVSVRQTSGWLCPFGSIPRLFARAGLADLTMFDGWSGAAAHALSETVLVVARRRQR